jgi:hypothetical protein
LTAGDASNVLITSFEAIPRDTVINFIPVNLASGTPALEDINVTLVANPTLVADYNSANGTNYVIPPPTMYTVLNPGLVVTIPKGSNTGYLQVRLRPSDFVGGEWALAYSIASIDKPGYIISGNLNKGMVAFGIKNRYDGVYNLRFKMIDWSVPYGISNLVEDWPSNFPIDMVTSGANSVKMFSTGHGAFIHVAVTTAGGLTAFGSTEPKFFFDLNTNALVNVTNDFPNPSNGRSFEMNPAITTSRWDPATGNIYAAIILKQPGRPDLQIYDTLTYVGPR